MFHCGVHTHFDGLIGDEACVGLRDRNWTFFRVRGLDRTTDEMLAMVDEARRVAEVTTVLCDRLEQIEALPAGILPVWRNEPNIGTDHYVDPITYARELQEAAEVARRNAVGQVGGPPIANLNTSGTDYLQKVIAACGGSLPENVFGCPHRYGHWSLFDGYVDTSHRLGKPKWKWWGPFESRAAEYQWFRKTIGEHRMWFIDEGGWASTGEIDELMQAKFCREELRLARDAGAFGYVWYQINDGLSADAIDHFGLRRVPDYSWKPVADAALGFEED